VNRPISPSASPSFGAVGRHRALSFDALGLDVVGYDVDEAVVDA